MRWPAHLLGCWILISVASSCDLVPRENTIVGRWQAVDDNQLDFLSGSGSAVLECLSDGTAVLREGSRSTSLIWRERDGGSIVLEQISDGRRATVGLVDVMGDALVVTDQGGSGRFMRLDPS